MRPLGRLPRRLPALGSSLISPTRRTAAAPSVRRASSSHHESDGDYGDDVYTKETFTSKPFLWTAGVIALWYGVYKASLENSPAFANDPASVAQPGSLDLVEEAEDERRPWLTRYMAYHFAPQTELYKKRNADNYDVIVAEATNKLFVNTAQMPSLRRRRHYSSFDDASSFNHEPGTVTDYSDLRIKTYDDDRMMPEKKEGGDGDGDGEGKDDE